MRRWGGGCFDGIGWPLDSGVSSTRRDNRRNG